MAQRLDPVEADGPAWTVWYLIGAAVVLIAAFVLVIVMFSYGKLWLQAVMSNAHVSMFSLVGMSFARFTRGRLSKRRSWRCRPRVGGDPETGITTRRLEAHYLAGGNVPRVIHALIAAHRADIDLDFDRAAAIDLAGRDVLDAVRTSVYPKVIDCPDPEKSGRTTLSAVAKNGVELLVRARVTVRTNLSQLIGGATEETIIARVGEGIITSIGSADGSFGGDGKPGPHFQSGAGARTGCPHGVRDRIDRYRRHRHRREHRRPTAGRSGRGGYPHGPGVCRATAGKRDCQANKR